MAFDTVDARNTTAATIDLIQLSVTVPVAPGQVNISDGNSPSEIQNDGQLRDEMQAGNIVLVVNAVLLNQAESLAFASPYASGATGPQGPQGSQGSLGSQGPQGPQGPQGAQGAGAQGPGGPQGAQGGTGAQGGVGPQGGAGPQGSQGAQGSAGLLGPQGPIGPQGSTGAQGGLGPQGAQGSGGPQGSQGSTGAGPQGAQGGGGPQGPQGSQGSQGPTGSSGVVAIGVYDNIGGQSFTGTVTIIYDTLRLNMDGAVFSFNPVTGEITVLQAGTYLVNFDVSTDTNSNTRVTSRSWLERDSGGGFVMEPGTYSFGYHRNTANGEDTDVLSDIPLVLAANEVLRVRTERFGTGGTLLTVLQGSRFNVKKIA